MTHRDGRHSDQNVSTESHPLKYQREVRTPRGLTNALAIVIGTKITDQLKGLPHVPVWQARHQFYACFGPEGAIARRRRCDADLGDAGLAGCRNIQRGKPGADLGIRLQRAGRRYHHRIRHLDLRLR
jgi:hypothetical protein